MSRSAAARWILLALLCFCASEASADATIDLVFSYRVYRLEPRGDWVNTGFGVSLRLTDGGTTDTAIRVEGGVEKRKSKLGVTGSDTGTKYHVVDEHTIVAMREFSSHVAIVTVHVMGQSCSATLMFHLKPGNSLYVMPTRGMDAEMPFRGVEGIVSRCSIR